MANQADHPQFVPPSALTPRAVVVLLWTMLCGWAWVASIGSIAGEVDQYTTDAEMSGNGCAMMITTGCLGSVWILGLLAVFLVVAILRR